MIPFALQPKVEALYRKFSDEPYVPRAHWTTEREFTTDPLYQHTAKQYAADPVFEKQSHEFVLDTTFDKSLK
jgi:hypothetical protein